LSVTTLSKMYPHPALHQSFPHRSTYIQYPYDGAILSLLRNRPDRLLISINCSWSEMVRIILSLWFISMG
jgi:hypothetical protein